MKLNTAKKLTAGALALSMMFAMATPMAFAAKGDEDEPTVKISKTYNLESDGTSPAETFYLYQEGDGVVVDGDAGSAPALERLDGNESAYVAKVVYDEGAAGNDSKETQEFEITLPSYDHVGVYEYTLKEKAGTTAGVTYRTAEIKLIVTVINKADGTIRVAGVHTEAKNAEGKWEASNKSDSFDDNTYSAGSLNVDKTVDGSLGDKNKAFKFTVTLVGEEGKTYNQGGYEIVGGINKSETEKSATSIKVGESATVYLKDASKIEIKNLPYGVTFTVEEDDYTDDSPANGYTTTYKVNEGSVVTSRTTSGTDKIASADENVSYTNKKGDGNIDTGVILDNAPYILMLAVVAGGAMMLVIKKRREEE